jgi:hypothetical protein
MIVHLLMLVVLSLSVEAKNRQCKSKSDYLFWCSDSVIIIKFMVLFGIHALNNTISLKFEDYNRLKTFTSKSRGIKKSKRLAIMLI